MGTFRAHVKIFCCFVICFYLVNISALWAVQRASIVICAETGKVHHEKDADAITHPASLTKMMTLYLTFKALRDGKLSFNQILPVSKRASEAAPCKLWLKAGSTITVRQAILGAVTESANDASIVLAEAIANGSEDHFAAMMTQQARRLGMSKTVFKNAHGLPNKLQVTTARDMATLSRALYKHFPEYFKFFKEQQFVYKGKVHPNHNRLLGKIPGLDGIKTGFINASGFNLAASVVRDNRRIIAVVMGGESAAGRNKQMVKLLEATYARGKRCDSHSPHSIEDLLSDSDADIHTASLHHAVYQKQSRPVAKSKYTSVAAILDAQLDSAPVKTQRQVKLSKVKQSASPCLRKPKGKKAASTKTRKRRRSV